MTDFDRDRPLKLTLISPRGPLYRSRGGIWKKSLRYAPLTLTTLAALIPPNMPVDLTLIDEGTAETDLNLQADLIGISAITGSAPRSYHLADHFRRRGIPVVLGGVHPTLMPNEAQQHADSVVVGYAEETFPQLLHDFMAGQLAARYTQSPDLSLLNQPRPHRNLLNPAHYATINTVEATRGCIHQCEFCVVPTAWGRPIQRPVAEVVADIQQMGATQVIFLDLNLIADLDYAKALFSALIPLNIKWGGLATTLVAWDEELLRLVAASGCRGLLIGFETLSDSALAETGKRFNSRHDYRQVVQRLHHYGIAVMGTFVFGFDNHTAQNFAETVDFVNEVHIDLPRYAILTPFPGTPLFNRLKAEGRILSEDWSLYDGQHVVFQPAQMSPDALWRQTEKAWKTTYRYRNIGRRLWGAKSRMPAIALGANLGYRFYAHRLHRYYTCDWPVSA